MKRSPERLLVVGGGMAAGRLLERLVSLDYPGRITLVGDEAVPAYNRVLLPALVAGTCTVNGLTNRSADWYRENGVPTVLGRRVVSIDPGRRVAELSSGLRLGFDRLVLATGASVPLPAIPGIHLPGVSTLRTLDDAQRLRALHATPGSAAVVVGGGLLGLEAAQSLMDLGADVRLVHRHRRLLNRQLDDDAAQMLIEILEGRGLHLVLNAEPVAIEGDQQVEAVRLTNGEVLPAATVVFATGTRPNDTLAVQAGIRCDTGIVVDEHMQTCHPLVSAIGECAVVGGERYALVEPVFRQADTLASVLIGQPAVFRPAPVATRLKVPGVALFSAGRLDDAHDSEQVYVRDPERGLYRRLIFRGHRLVGALLFGDLSGSRQIQSLIAGGGLAADLQSRAALAFGLGQSAGDSP